MEIDGPTEQDFSDLTRDHPQFPKKCQHFVSDIVGGTSSFLDLVEKLQALLADTSPERREQGAWILSEVLKLLPGDFLGDSELACVCNFFVDRLKDHHRVVPAVLCGLLALTRMRHFPSGATQPILNSIFDNISCQQQQRQDRQTIYEILHDLVTRQKEQVRGLGLVFVYGVMSAVDGERDPNNLVFLFSSFYPNFLKSVDVGNLNEEMFEILACYFPVDFKAPPQEKAITREILAESLMPCLVCVPEFGEQAIGLALEKLDSSLEIARMDSLRLLEIGCSTLPIDPYTTNITDIWSQIQKALFSDPNPTLSTALSKTLATILNKISTGETFETILSDICDSFKGNLYPASKFFPPSKALTVTLAQSSTRACIFVTKHLAPTLINLAKITENSEQRRDILTLLVTLFIENKTRGTDLSDVDIVPGLLIREVGTNWDNLGLVVEFLTSEDRAEVVRVFRARLFEVPSRPDESVMRCFKGFATLYPELVRGEIIERLDNPVDYIATISPLIEIASFRHFVLDLFLNNLNDTTVDYLGVVVGSNESSDILGSLWQAGVVANLIDFASRTSREESLDAVHKILAITTGSQTSQVQTDILFAQLDKIVTTTGGANRIVLLSGLLTRLRRGIAVDLTSILDLLLASSCARAVQLLANLVNKCDEPDVLTRALAKVDETCPNVQVWAWTTKGLIGRNHPEAVRWLDKLVALLREDDEEVATCFGVLMRDDFECLSARSYCNKSPVYHQKLFVLVTRQLDENNLGHLVAFGYLLEFTPRRVVLLQFTKISRLITNALDKITRPEVLITLLTTLRDLIETKEPCVLDSIELSQVLKLSTFTASMSVRILALQCLQAIATHCQLYKLLPHKTHVIATLGICIDDKKRLVRKEAVKARASWYILGAPI